MILPDANSLDRRESISHLISTTFLYIQMSAWLIVQGVADLRKVASYQSKQKVHLSESNGLKRNNKAP